MERDYFPCSPNPECPYALSGNCREDIHHYYQNPVPSHLARIFRNLPQNTVETCRRFHETVLDLQPKEYPDQETMRQEIIDADMAGQICLSATKRRAVYGK